LVNSIDSKIGQIQGYAQSIQNGQIVRPEVALQIAQAAEEVVNTISQGAQRKAQAFKSQATTVGLGPQWDTYIGGFEQGYGASTTQKPADTSMFQPKAASGYSSPGYYSPLSTLATQSQNKAPVSSAPTDAEYQAYLKSIGSI
jgi:hypothetical protein